MRHITTDDFDDLFDVLPVPIQNKYKKQLEYLLTNFRHPSLQSKKYGGTNNVFQARVDKSYRFYFKVEKDYYLIFWIGQHPK